MLVPSLALTKGYFLPSFYLCVCPWLQESALGHVGRSSKPGSLCPPWLALGEGSAWGRL